MTNSWHKPKRRNTPINQKIKLKQPNDALNGINKILMNPEKISHKKGISFIHAPIITQIIIKVTIDIYFIFPIQRYEKKITYTNFSSFLFEN